MDLNYKHPTITHMLYLRVRNKDRDIIDLISPRTRCALLTDTGCPFTADERPSGGKNLIPNLNGECLYQMKPNEFIFAWDKHQKILQRLVQRISGKSLNQNIKEDVYDLFVRIIKNDFNGVDPIEIRELLTFARQLVIFFLNEWEQAKKDANYNCVLRNGR